MYEEFQILKPSIEQIFPKTDINSQNKWQLIFKNLTLQNVQNVFKIVSFVMSIPSSNCYVERVFSQMNLKWTDIRNRCSADMISTELKIMFNYNITCTQFYQYLNGKKDFVKKIQSNQKYEK
uniref:HAT C-terminal dimerisation domain-containing protein n=1 Tax=Cacopsylla melanoneura TaxID=428564 RepID=A0A8D8W711_9HEMI